MLGIRLERQLEARLEALAERSGKPKSYHAREAIRRYLLTDESEARLDRIKRVIGSASQAEMVAVDIALGAWLALDGFQADHKIELYGPLHREVGEFGILEYPQDVQVKRHARAFDPLFRLQKRSAKYTVMYIRTTLQAAPDKGF